MHTHEQTQVGTASIATASISIGFNIHKRKNNIVKYNTENTNEITFEREAPETSNYLLSIIDEHGRPDADVKESIGKARAAFLQLKNIWKSKQLSINYKVIIFNTNVKTVLLYGAETWRTTTTIIKSAQVLTNHLLYKILDLISNNLLREKTNQLRAEEEIRKGTGSG
ncbi:unnamed protein product [Schistosoma margrebowiei]|uniref:Uncharacterized protein n=1 Tax=Schistosoma margrebowiei TaxID=48269 RepID=A0A183M6D9_9TREM|nr:unnamed protein product [Schistosoma margrebowiei]